MFKKLCWEILFRYKNAQQKRLIRVYKKKYPDYIDDEYNCDNLKFIWGIKSYDDMSSSDANMWTMNDIDIYYDRDTKQYSLGVETIYMFDDTQAEYAYYNSLLESFTKYMKENGLDTERNYCTFCSGLDLSLKADSIEELYARFKIAVTGLCAVCEERGNYEYH